MERRIYILGRPSFLNQVLEDLIRKTISSVACTAVQDVESLPSDEECPAAQLPLLLINDDDHELLAEIDSHGVRGILALFNVRRDRDVCREVAYGVVRGVFFVEDKVEHVIKGVRALLQGDIWVPRRLLVEAVLSRSRETEQEKARLTRREMEILMAVSTGATNDEVAQRMYLSAHTVKTHLYNIYKKIGATNRLHAARWAMKHSAAFPVKMPVAAEAQGERALATIT
jgi:LuxR family transcriptional regulator of csgAB operon